MNNSSQDAQINLRAKKSLGQNFLSHPPTIRAIVGQSVLVSEQTDCKWVLEIGPGKGVLTDALLQAGLSVVAIEKDKRMVNYLQEQYAEQIEKRMLVVVEGDALELDKALADITVWQKKETYQVVANLPYYITGIFIRTMLEHDYAPTAMTLLLQKEVVDRIVANDNKHSLLSVSVQVFAEVKKLCNVKKQYFTPVPKVDSAVIAITNISQDRFSAYGITVQEFFVCAKAAFASRRKTLANNLKILLTEYDKKFIDLVVDLDTGAKVRAEDLVIEQFLKITKFIHK